MVRTAESDALLVRREHNSRPKGWKPTYTYARLPNRTTHARTHTQTHVRARTHTHTHTHTYNHTYTHAHTQTNEQTHTHARVDTHTHTPTHTIQTHTHAHTQPSSGPYFWRTWACSTGPHARCIAFWFRSRNASPRGVRFHCVACGRVCGWVGVGRWVFKRVCAAAGGSLYCQCARLNGAHARARCVDRCSRASHDHIKGPSLKMSLHRHRVQARMPQIQPQHTPLPTSPRSRPICPSATVHVRTCIQTLARTHGCTGKRTQHSTTRIHTHTHTLHILCSKSRQCRRTACSAAAGWRWGRGGRHG